MQVNRVFQKDPVAVQPSVLAARHEKILGLLMSAGIALAGVSCTSTKVTSYPGSIVQRAGPFQSVVVVAVDDRSRVRELVEDLFVKRLEERGVRAVTSYGTFPLSELKGNREQVRQKLVATQAETVLLTRLAGQADVITTSAVGIGMWDSALEWMQPYGQPVELQGGGEIRSAVRLESNLYRLQDAALAWVAHTDTVLKEDTDRTARIRAVVQMLVNRMAKDGVIN